MNVALYKLNEGHHLIGARSFPGCTRQQLVEMAMGIKIAAMEDGIQLDKTLLVAWQDRPSDYMSVIPLGDDLVLDEILLDSIESLARTRH